MFKIHRKWRVIKKLGIVAVHFGGSRSFPQVAALHEKSGYFRLTCGECGWGTSVVLLPTFWAMNRLFQGAPVQTRWQTDDEDLCLSLASRIAHLDVSAQVRLHPPEPQSITAHVSVQVESDPALDGVLDERPDEAFKPVMLSSMRIDEALWDTDAALIHSQAHPLPAQGWILEPGLQGNRFALRGGTSRWKTRAPTIEITLDRVLSLAGWVTPSVDPNDDNIGLWAGSPSWLRSWNYTLVASSDTSA
jgi:hypothetical protein